MNFRRLGTLLIGGGFILVVAAAAWWWSFYAPLAQDMNVDLSRAVRCLYSTSGACGLVSGVAQLGGKTPYEPMLLWIGLGALAAGFLIRLSSAPPRA